jgi:hypothetical protein
MDVLKATQQDYEDLDGYQNGPDRLEFRQDADGNWICGTQNIDNPAFAAIRDRLDGMERIPFNPPPPPDEGRPAN